MGAEASKFIEDPFGIGWSPFDPLGIGKAAGWYTSPSDALGSVGGGGGGGGGVSQEYVAQQFQLAVTTAEASATRDHVAQEQRITDVQQQMIVLAAATAALFVLS
jgi:hypothetical protein